MDILAGAERRELISRGAAALEHSLTYLGYAGTRLPGTESVDVETAAEAVLMGAGIIPAAPDRHQAVTVPGG